MSIKRFVGPNAREAMAQVRRELGDDALVLSTKKLTGGRVEVLAAAPDEVADLIEDSRSSRVLPRAPQAAPHPAASVNAPAAPMVARSPAAAATRPTFAARLAGRTAAAARIHAPGTAVRTESFESFVRRQTQPEAAASFKPASSAHSQLAAYQVQAAGAADVAPRAVAEAPSVVPALEQAPAPAVFRRREEPLPQQPAAVAAQPAAPAAVPVVAEAATRTPSAVPAIASAAADAQLLTELQSMRALMLEQMAALNVANSAGELQRRSPLQLRATTRLLTAGFSADVACRIAERIPQQLDLQATDGWLADVLALNVKCVPAGDDLIARGGIYALVGPTGVGKTTTVAKLAARFAVRQGAQALGLITLDAYRVGAHEQLRAYGRILGVPVHLAQDAATLRELLAAMANKKLVLIDTCGVSQRDERLQEMLAMLEQAALPDRTIASVLLLNAASHAETLDDVARAWRTPQCAGTILTKLDEAARIGGALDCILRRKLPVLGLTNGQRVPEDWVAADGRLLASAALKPGHSAFALSDADGAALAAQVRATAAIH